MPQISKQRVENQLEKIAGKQIINEFLGENKDEFTQFFNLLYAQLKDGDDLKVEFNLNRTSRVMDGPDLHFIYRYHPHFEIVLYQKGMEKATLASCDRNGIRKALMFCNSQKLYDGGLYDYERTPEDEAEGRD